LELAQTVERELIWKAQEMHNDAIQWGVDVDSEGSEEGWPGVPSDAKWSDLQPEDPLRTHGWPSVGGVQVEVEVCSVIDEVEGHSTCRCL
jgi:hypothetical protein